MINNAKLTLIILVFFVLNTVSTQWTANRQINKFKKVLEKQQESIIDSLSALRNRRINNNSLIISNSNNALQRIDSRTKKILEYEKVISNRIITNDKRKQFISKHSK